MSYNGPPQAGMVPAPAAGVTQHWMSQTQFSVKRDFWSLFGRKFRVFTPDGTQVAFVKHPIFRWRPEFTVFADESETQPLLHVKARSIIGFNIANDVFDAPTGQLVGTIRSRGLKSIVRDTWDLLGPGDQPVGMMQEEGNSLLRRFIPLLLGKWKIELNGVEVVQVKQVFRFFTKEVKIDMSMGVGKIETRFAVALGMFALMAESRRESS